MQSEGWYNVHRHANNALFEVFENEMLALEIMSFITLETPVAPLSKRATEFCEGIHLDFFGGNPYSDDTDAMEHIIRRIDKQRKSKPTKRYEKP